MLFEQRPFFYRRLASPLHAARAGVGAAWALALTAAAFELSHPLVLLALTLAVLGAGAAAGVGRQLARTLRTAAIVAVPIVAVNVLVSRQGLTVFARLGDLGPFGQGDLTLEAAVYGAVIALKVALLILVTTLASLAVDPDELLRGLGRLSFRSALTASLCTRMIPLLAADAQRLAEAQRTRPGGAPGGARARVALVGGVVGGSLDRAMDVAATLELRGFAAARGSWGAERRSGRAMEPRSGRATARRSIRASFPGLRDRVPSLRSSHPLHAPSRHDVAFACSAVAIVALATLGWLGGAASFQAYPLVHAPVGVGTPALCAALIVAVLLPFGDRRGIEL
ncbi:MAG TPA: energy-coupling factor transporter transmembrane component T [Solirubrobacteraceae bacterium]|nr:energy-coupling factor transporter transmembrane component T [Solirubrobacteraceae bacterium]